MKRTFIKPILITFLFNDIIAEEYKNGIKFKEEVGMTDGPNGVYFESDSITKENLSSLNIRSPLKKLVLVGDSVCLFRTIKSQENAPVYLKHLVLDSIIKKSPLSTETEKEACNGRVHVKDLCIIEAHGITAIKEILYGISSDSRKPLKILKLVTDELIEFKDIIKTGKSTQKMELKTHKILRIEGPISIKLIKEIYEIGGEKTQTVSIECDSNDIASMTKEGERIKKWKSLKKVVLINGAISLAFSDSFKLFNSKIKELVFSIHRTDKYCGFAESGLVKDKKIQIIECDDLSFYKRAIILLPLIDNKSLNDIKRIGVSYKKKDVRLDHVLSKDESKYEMCEEILQKQATTETCEFTIRAGDEFSSTSPLKRLHKIFYSPKKVPTKEKKNAVKEEKKKTVKEKKKTTDKMERVVKTKRGGARDPIHPPFPERLKVLKKTMAALIITPVLMVLFSIISLTATWKTYSSWHLFEVIEDPTTDEEEDLGKYDKKGYCKDDKDEDSDSDNDEEYGLESKKENKEDKEREVNRDEHFEDKERDVNKDDKSEDNEREINKDDHFEDKK
eukprot:GHVP01070456.1.p1 GENE.GHVP01070456.1~~GHVP01070456.1.p1  ORF type:complete len:562 (-),score=136.35 GHVP01070456.1:75-1760(-)